MLRRIALLASGLLAAAFISGCGGGDDHPAPAPIPATPDIVQLAQATPDLSILVEAVVAAGLVDTLKAAGPFTVFAPTNAAFAALLTELGITKEALLANKPLLTTVLTYHVLPAKVERAGIPAGKPITTVQGSIFKIEANNNVLTISDGRNRTSRIVATDIQGKNGVVHTIDRVILPADKNIVQTAVALPQFSVLVEAVTAAGLTTTLSGTGNFTVFAPTNDAFTALLAELNITKAALLADRALLTRVLTYHVLPNRVLKADVPTNVAIATVQGDTLRISPALVITDQRTRTANITATDVLATNGVIHVIDKVILPTPAPAPVVPDLVALAQSNPNLSILVEAVVAAGLVDTLKGTGPFTVFAPTNAAFTELLAELSITKEALLANKALLTTVLTYHVLPAKVEKAGIPAGKAIKSVEGGIFKIESIFDVLTITDGRNRKSAITATDIQARNGVVHTINKVLLPADRSIVQTAQSLSQFTILVEAVVAADLVTTLSGTTQFTVFAPTNEAFVALLAELNVTKAALLADKALLTKVLTYHVVPGTVLKAEVPTNVNIATVQGDTLRIDPAFIITDQRGRTAKITATDIFNTNGVIHVVDKVILPKP